MFEKYGAIALFGFATVTTANVAVITDQLYNTGLDGSGSLVAASGGDETSSSTDYVFTTTFDLTGYDAATAEIMGSWGVDNYASIFLNGNDTSVSLAFFTSLNPNPSPMALRFDDLELTANAVPEPSIIVLFGLGLVGLGFARRRR